MSFIFGAYAYYNSKLNINRMEYKDVPVIADCIDGIGESTLNEVVENKPYSDLKELKQLGGIGDKKYKIMKSHFDTHDICRTEIFNTSIILSVISNIFGFILVFYDIIKRKIDEKELREAIGLRK